MKDRLVSDCIQILRLLLDGPTNVNSIIKETGLYKNNVFEANKTLKDAELITKNPKGKQTFILKLTELGIEVARLMNSITEFNKSYLELASFIKANFQFEERDKKGLRKMLLAINWTKKEIKHYSRIAEGARTCKQFSLNLFSEALIARYCSLFIQFRPNDKAIRILIKVIADALSEQLIVRLKGFVIDWPLPTIPGSGDLPYGNQIFSEFQPSLLEYIEDGDLYPFGLADNKTVEIRNICKSLLHVMAPPKEYVQESLEQLNSEDNPVNVPITSLYDEYLQSS